MNDNDKWITDRRPTAEDGDWFWVTNEDGKARPSHRSSVNDLPWILKPRPPKPYVKPGATKPIRRKVIVPDDTEASPDNATYTTYVELFKGDPHPDVVLEVMKDMSKYRYNDEIDWLMVCDWVKQLEESRHGHPHKEDKE